MNSTKEEMIRVIQEQPDDANFTEILTELSFARMVRNGLADSKANRVITSSEMKNEIASWRN